MSRLTASVSFLAASLPRTALTVVVLVGMAVAVAVAGFRLRVSGALSLYFVIWWVLIFAALPFGVRSQADAGEVAPGTDPGAPSLPKLREKVVWTSLGAGLVLLATAWLLPLAGL